MHRDRPSIRTVGSPVLTAVKPETASVNSRQALPMCSGHIRAITRREVCANALGLSMLALAPGTRAWAQQPAPTAAAGNTDELTNRIPAVFAFAQQQYTFMLNQIRFSKGLPRTLVNGRLKTVDPTDWTSGFFPGALWYVFEYSQASHWRRVAQSYTRLLEKLQHFRDHHDLGFMLFCSYGNGYRLTRDPGYRRILIEGARSLATRFDPKVGMTRSWDFGPWKFPVIVDNLMNLEMLLWVARETGESRLHDISLQHADNTLKHHFREDGSGFHLVDFDPATGAVLKKQTVQGAADSSTWARGHAWGLYGFTMMYRETRRAGYLAHALKMAQFVIDHPRLPEDKVPYWDFDAPDIPNAPRDSSAAAIMASAMLELSTFSDPQASARLRATARKQLLSLSSPAYLAPLGENGGFLLKHAVGAKPHNIEIDVPLIYGDYYFLEALLRYRRLAVT